MLLSVGLASCTPESSASKKQIENPENAGISMSEVTRIIASDVQIKPGMWETTAAMTKSDIQELPNDSEFARTVIGKMRHHRILD